MHHRGAVHHRSTTVDTAAAVDDGGGIMDDGGAALGFASVDHRAVAAGRGAQVDHLCASAREAEARTRRCGGEGRALSPFAQRLERFGEERVEAACLLSLATGENEGGPCQLGCRRTLVELVPQADVEEGDELGAPPGGEKSAGVAGRVIQAGGVSVW